MLEMITLESIIVDAEFRSLIPPLTESERDLLEESLSSEGCRDALIVWKEQKILLDGHHRKDICDRHKIDYRVTEINLTNREAAADWIDKNQLARRNLNPDQMAILRGRRYNRVKKQWGGQREKARGQNDPLLSTAEKLASEYSVSPRTIKRDGEVAAYLEDRPDDCRAVLHGEKKLTDVRRESKRATIIENLEDIEAQEIKAVQGVYDVIVIDPPWPMKKIEREVRPNQSEFDYPTMTEEEMAALEIPCADDCHVFLWTTQRFLPMALRLFDKWGMRYVLTFVWHKPGGFQPIGLPQYNAEFAVYGRKGKPAFVDTKAFPTCFTAPRGKHSEKPQEFYEMIQRVTRGRRLDMFSRRVIEGYDRWGNEVEQDGI